MDSIKIGSLVRAFIYYTVEASRREVNSRIRLGPRIRPRPRIRLEPRIRLRSRIRLEYRIDRRNRHSLYRSPFCTVVPILVVNSYYLSNNLKCSELFVSSTIR